MRKNFSMYQRQRGAILVVSLLLLLVMTVLALTASQTTRLQERMAGNARDIDLAFQAGEAALRAAEARLDATNNAPPNSCDDPESCTAQARPETSINYTVQDDDFWADSGYEYGGDEKDLKEVAEDPVFYTEEWATVEDTLTVDRPTQAGVTYYANTAKAVGGSKTASVFVQSTYAVRWAR